MRNVCVAMILVGITASAGWGNLLGRYYQGVNVESSTGVILTEGLTESFSRVDANIDYWNGTRYYRWQPVSGYGDNYTVEWTGYVWIGEAGAYGIGTMSDDGSQIWIDGEMVVDNGEAQWYDWEDNLTEFDTDEPNGPLNLTVGFHSIMVRFYEEASYDGIELWWLVPGSGESDIPYYGTTFHGTAPTANPNTNWVIVPAEVLYTEDEYAALGCTMELNGDGVINLHEFSVLAEEWLTATPIDGDFSGDGHVDMADLAMLANVWLKECAGE